VTEEQLIVEGGHRLNGRIRAGGSKNAALPIMAATLLTAEPCVLSNLPAIEDLRTMGEVLGHLGVAIERSAPDQLTLRADEVVRFVAPHDLVSKMRASFLVLGPLRARFGRARVSQPGGCAIGSRGVELHLRGLELMGATITAHQGYYEAEVAGEHLRGAEIYLDVPTVTGTENLMMAAALAEGTTVISNAAQEPHVQDLAAFLNAMGGSVDGAGSATIVIEGRLQLQGTAYTVQGDPIEAGTYAIVAAAAGGEVVIDEVEVAHLRALSAKLRLAGAELEERLNSLTVRSSGELEALDFQTMPHPGFPTDLQAPMMALLTQAKGTSVVTEVMFENRFLHVPELRRMGADIVVEGRSAVVRGPSALSGTPVTIPDLRSGAALAIAGLVAEGITEISGVQHLDRGYEGLEAKLSALGAHIFRRGQRGAAGALAQAG
jgi:UDP-N-acetylglucosamine 1-carboxyvinyltransferase